MAPDGSLGFWFPHSAVPPPRSQEPPLPGDPACPGPRSGRRVQTSGQRGRPEGPREEAPGHWRFSEKGSGATSPVAPPPRAPSDGPPPPAVWRLLQSRAQGSRGAHLTEDPAEDPAKEGRPGLHSRGASGQQTGQAAA